MSSVYWQTVPRCRPPLEGDTTADVAIVGAGIGGLATAWHLAERGIRSVILDARSVAAGASGRNGGFLIAGAALMYNDARRSFGPPLARRIYEATLSAQREVYGVAEQIGAGDCFRQVGLLRLAVDSGEASHVREHAAALTEDGFPGDVVAESELHPLLRRDGRCGLRTAHDASVDPYRWLNALADALVARGCLLGGGTTVAAPARSGRLDTDRGAVTCGSVVVAADAHVGTLVPEYTGLVRPRRLHMLATAAVSGDRVRHPVYARYGYEYHQQLPDGRVLLGGFSDLDGEESYTAVESGSDRVWARLQRYLVDELAVDAPVTHRWVGVVGYTADHRPFAGPARQRSDVYVLGGYSGTGNLCAWVGGRIVADLIARGDSPDRDLFDATRPAPTGADTLLPGGTPHE